ncbi:hypothetical protein ACGFSB_29325 [Streptomyces sp. NPDC048441]|uniref:hypothetical protein n=1 Tax=Streptomyces sp. NPDC048441 TaxID=3365552 RepID=UPI00371BC613
MIHRPYRHRKRFAWTDYRDLPVRAHLQLDALNVLLWGNLNTHRAAGMCQHATEHDWLTIGQLLSCSPDLNPVEGMWPLLRRGPLTDVTFTDDEHLEHVLRHASVLYPAPSRTHRRLPRRQRASA